MIIGSDSLNENFQKDYALVKDVLGDRLENLLVIPGLSDVHVHFREPGFEYKETIETGSKAAGRGDDCCADVDFWICFYLCPFGDAA